MNTRTPLTDDDLRALTPVMRRVIRLMAQGGWASGSPGRTAVYATCDAVGLSFEDEQCRGEPRAFWPRDNEKREWIRLARRLDELPRRRPVKAQPRPMPSPPPRPRPVSVHPDMDVDAGWQS